RSPQLLAARARLMRFAPTEAEALLWRELRGGKLGVWFRRQVPVAGRYIADFAAPEVRLIVEVDGGYHDRRGRADAQRDQVLRRAGWRVVRVPAKEVRSNIGAAVERVRAAI
ncbi:MAG: endonuclease domain-containing protein, partial [Planctomycetia bacterium]|nr:endonuclease domain-containing protein [Planctomycetia bacterium]